jgi:integrase
VPSVRLRRLNKATKRLASGRVVTYWYAWRGGPRLDGKPGTPEFIASYNQAIAGRTKPVGDTLSSLVARYKASPEWASNAKTTKKQWARWLDRISADDDADLLAIGGLPFEVLDSRKVRAKLLAWRDQWAAHPRQADYAMQVLGRVLSWGMDRGLIALNAAAGTEQLYESSRADQIWTADELALFALAAPSPEVGVIPWLACQTGLRREDLATVAWSHVGRNAIVKPTFKSRGRRNAIVVLDNETRELLAQIRAQQERRHAELCERARKLQRPGPPMPLTILSNTRGRPWSVDGLEHQVIDTKHIVGIDKHLHDGRGTYGTYLRRRGLKASEIADALGWDEARVERLLATYVDFDEIVLGIAERLNRNEDGS